MVSLRSLSPEQPQFHLQKYISYKSISKIQGPQKCISLSLRLFNDSGTGCLFHSDVLVLLMGNVAIWREDEECELPCPNQSVVPRPRIVWGQPIKIPSLSVQNQTSTCPCAWRALTLLQSLKLFNFQLISYVWHQIKAKGKAAALTADSYSLDVSNWSSALLFSPTATLCVVSISDGLAGPSQTPTAACAPH